MNILVKDGVRYLSYRYKDEDELERMVIEDAEAIFGADVILFSKAKIKTHSGISTVPDGFIVTISDRRWYLLEVELASHPLYEHTVVQLNKFNSAIRNPRTRERLTRAFYGQVDKDVQIKHKLESNSVVTELYKFLSDTILTDPEVVIVIDQKNKELEDVCQTLPFRATALRFETYYREGIGTGVHIHAFDTLVDRETKEETSARKGGEPVGKITPAGRRRMEINLTNLHTPKTFALIPITKAATKHRKLLPGYKEPFTLITDIGEIRTKVTSAPKGTKYGDPEAGSYIQGGLKPWYERHPHLKEGDKLIIEEVEPKRRYRLYIE